MSSTNTDKNATIKAFLEGPLPKKAPEKKDRFTIDTPFEVKPLPIPFKAKLTTDELALARTVSDDWMRPAMCGIYHDMVTLCRVTTNSHYLFVLPDKSLNLPQSLIISPDGTKIYEPFPNYRDVIVSHDNQMVIDNPVSVLSDLVGVLRAMRFIDGFIQTRIVYDGYSIMINPEFMFLAIRTLVETGSQKIIVELPDFGAKKAIIFRDALKPERFAMVMPIMETSNALTCTIIEGSTFPEDPQQATTFLNNQLHRALAEVTFGMEYHHNELREAITKDCDWSIEYHRKKINEECWRQEAKLRMLRKNIQVQKSKLRAYAGQLER